MNERTPEQEPANNSHQNITEQAAAPGPATARRNPRLVVGNLDFFELLMEQDEQ